MLRFEFGFSRLDPCTFRCADSDELNLGHVGSGPSYTTLEFSTSTPSAHDIIEYDTPSGQRSILVPASQLKPAGVEDKPLNIEDYSWDRDFKQLLVFTECAESSPLRWMQIPGDPLESFIFRINWVDDRPLSIVQLNRKQNTATVCLSDASSDALA